MDPSTLSRVISKVWGHGLREGWGRNVFLRPPSDHHNKVAKRKENLKVLPCLNLLKCISAQDEEKSMLLSLSKMSEGVDGERPPGPWKFKITGRKMGIVWGSQPHHFEPMLRLHNFFCHLVGRNGRRDENNLIKLECLPNFFCPSEMAEMDRIEGPSE